MDLISGFNGSTVSGGGFNTWNNVLDPSFLVHNKNGQLFWNYSNPIPKVFSALPHLGVAYMFGSNAQQYLKSEYQHVFRYNVMLNVRYIKNLSNGILRNSGFSHDDVGMMLQKKGKRYSFELNSSYVSSRIEQSGGVVTDTLADLYDLSLIPVRRAQSEIKIKRAQTAVSNYFDFNKDSLRAIGLLTSHALRIKKYELSETDTLYGIYPVINYDSTNAYDRHQLSALSNGAGVYYSDQSTFFSVSPEINYWQFYNLGRFNDTTELTITASLAIKRERFKFATRGSYNVSGAKNEWLNESSMTVRLGKSSLWLNLLNQALLPEPYQRYAVGNSTLPIQTEFEKQVIQRYTAGFRRSWSNLTVHSELGYAGLRNNYWFIDSIWRNDTLTNCSDFYFQPSLSYQWKIVNLHLSYRINMIQEQMDFLPKNQLAMRVFFKGGLFKDKKMKAYGGVDLGYSGSYQIPEYLTQTATFSRGTLLTSVQPLYYLHAFGGFQVHTFRFFFRVENIQSFWREKSVQSFAGFPVTPLQVRIGITWDFFD
ncbi:MAG: hypothetical protein RIT43_1076 [Bacteroidota bacterium]